MGDYDVQMLIEIEGDPAAVRGRLNAVDGIATWWSSKVEGSAAAVGDRFGVFFPDAPVPFDFTVATMTDDRIEWRSGEMPPPWTGTTIRFDIAANAEGGGTGLRFEHKGFDPDSETIAIVTPTWANILMRLKANIEGGGDRAFFQVG